MKFNNDIDANIDDLLFFNTCIANSSLQQVRTTMHSYTTNASGQCVWAIFRSQVANVNDSDNE